MMQVLAILSGTVVQGAVVDTSAKNIHLQSSKAIAEAVAFPRNAFPTLTLPLTITIIEQGDLCSAEEQNDNPLLDYANDLVAYNSQWQAYAAGVETLLTADVTPGDGSWQDVECGWNGTGTPPSNLLSQWSAGDGILTNAAPTAAPTAFTGSCVGTSRDAGGAFYTHVQAVMQFALTLDTYATAFGGLTIPQSIGNRLTSGFCACSMDAPAANTCGNVAGECNYETCSAGMSCLQDDNGLYGCMAP